MEEETIYWYKPEYNIPESGRSVLIKYEHGIFEAESSEDGFEEPYLGQTTCQETIKFNEVDCWCYMPKGIK